MKTGGNFQQDLEKDLKDPKFRVLFEREKQRLRLSERLHHALSQSRLSIRKAATFMGTSKSQVERIINDPKANVSVDTLIKFAAAIGKSLEIRIK